MTTPTSPQSFRPRIWAAIALFAACCLPGAPAVAQVQSPLEQQRQKLRAPAVVTPLLRGTVVSVRSGAILTSITTADSRAAGIADDASLRLGLAGRTLDARFMSPTRYARLVRDPVARKTLDVDVVCTPDSSGALVVIGLGGGLPEGLGVSSGMPVTLEKR